LFAQGGHAELVVDFTEFAIGVRHGAVEVDAVAELGDGLLRFALPIQGDAEDVGEAGVLGFGGGGLTIEVDGEIGVILLKKDGAEGGKDLRVALWEVGQELIGTVDFIPVLRGATELKESEAEVAGSEIGRWRAPSGEFAGDGLGIRRRMSGGDSDAVAGDGGVRDIIRANARHMAGDALLGGLMLFGVEQSGVTGEAGGANFRCAIG